MNKITVLCLIVLVPTVIAITLLIAKHQIPVNNANNKNDTDVESQDNVKKDVNDNSYTLTDTTFKVSNIIAIERFTTLQTGSKSVPYKYWDKNKFELHQNCFGAQCNNTDYKCSMDQSTLEKINDEFIKAIQNPKKITYYYEYPTMDLYGTGFGLTLADGRKLFLAFTPTNLVASCVIGTECLISKRGDKILPYTEMGHEEFKNITLFEGNKLMDMLIDLNKLQRENYTNCKDIRSW